MALIHQLAGFKIFKSFFSFSFWCIQLWIFVFHHLLKLCTFLYDKTKLGFKKIWNMKRRNKDEIERGEITFSDIKEIYFFASIYWFMNNHQLQVSLCIIMNVLRINIHCPSQYFSYCYLWGYTFRSFSPIVVLPLTN